jgi:hypothetical protein
MCLQCQLRKQRKKDKKPNFQSYGNKSQQSRDRSADRAQQRDRSDRTSPHNDGLKSNRNPRRGR